MKRIRGTSEVLEYEFCFVPLAETEGAKAEDTASSEDESTDTESNDSAETETDSNGGDGTAFTEKNGTETEDEKSQDLILSYTISYQETQIADADIAHGLMTPAFTVNGETSTFTCDMTNESTVTLQFSFYGTPNVTYALTLFVNNSPVFFDGEPLEIHLQEGKLTNLEIEYDMSYFDGEMIVYAVLAPKNYIVARAKGLVENTGCLRASPTLYLTSAGSFEELRNRGE